MSNFDPGKMLSFDLETTGIDPYNTRIVTSSLISINGSQVDTWDALADPGVEIPKEASDVHGITTEHARANGRPHDKVLEATITRIREGWANGQTLIVYNAAYDLTVLAALDPNFRVEGPVFDPYIIDRIQEPRRPGNRRLSTLCEIYGITLDNAHNSTADSLAAARVAWFQAQKYPELVQMSTDELMEFQAVGYDKAQRSLKAYFERERPERAQSVALQWPIAEKLSQ
ncbi:MAG: 3'-5' exonuclease [Corynebacterium sp.]|nr:3'-5' exonuclease [Corynebacterium sp.]